MRISYRKTLVMGLFCILLVQILIYNIPLPINRTYNAIEINMADDTHCIERTVTLNGYYKVNLLTDDYYSGELLISGYEATCQGFLFSGVSICKSGDFLLYENYSSMDSNPPQVLLFGRLYAGFMFQELVIAYVIDANGNNNDTSTCNVIVVNADTREAAYQIASNTF